MPTEKRFKTVEELQSLIDAYFVDCDESKKPYTIEGLCVKLEIDRKTLLNYEKAKGYEQYFHTIKKAKDKVLQILTERALVGDNVPSISIFLLKNNYGYVDRQEVTGADGESLGVNVVFQNSQVKPIENEAELDDI